MLVLVDTSFVGRHDNIALLLFLTASGLHKIQKQYQCKRRNQNQGHNEGGN